MRSFILTVDDRPDFVARILEEYNDMSELEGDSLEPCQFKIDEFSDGEYSPQFLHSVRGARVYAVGSTNSPQNIMRMCLTLDGARRASAAEVVAVVPYFGYGRQDRKDGKRGAIGAKTVMNMLIASGAQRIMTMDLHAEQVEGFVDVPFDHIHGQRIFESDVRRYMNSNPAASYTLLSPDVGGTKRIDKYFRRLGDAGMDVNVAFISKERDKPNSIGKMTLIGDVKGRNVVIIDDMIDTAGTLCASAQLCMDLGAVEVIAMASHGVFSGPAKERLAGSVFKEGGVIVSNSVNQTGDIPQVLVMPCERQIAKFMFAVNKSVSPIEMEDI